MNILIIGGTRFQGLHIVKQLIRAGHTVVVFHLGNHKIAPCNGLVDIIGDRNLNGDLENISGYQFDICIDTCAYFPEQVALVAEKLNIYRYCIISSVLAYEDNDAILSEFSNLSKISDKLPRTINAENYGALKAMCEQVTLDCFGERSLIIRPSIIVGIGDHTERLLFWMRLASIHGKQISFQNHNPILQLIDVRDLARFVVRCIENGLSGPVNVCGEPIYFSALLDLISSLIDEQLEKISINLENLQEFGMSRLPFYEITRVARYSTDIAKSWGFTGRDLLDSLTDIFSYSKTTGFAMKNFKYEEMAVLRFFK